MKIEAERGYLIIAQNTDDVDYVRCARILSKSLKKTQPTALVCLVTDIIPENTKDFDFVKIFPFGDHAQNQTWKLHNDWQCFYATPFRQTIKIEADIVVPQSIEHWFDILQHKDLVVMLGAKDFRNRMGTSRHYRKIFDVNELPDAYNAITYWRVSKAAQTFFTTVKKIIMDWPEVMQTLLFGKNQPVNTDLAYAIALKILGIEHYTLPLSVPSMIHLKSKFNGLDGDDWSKELIWEITDNDFRINTVSQMWPIHYQQKTFVKELEKYYG